MVFMTSFSTSWIWQQEDWPKFHWRDEVIQPLLRSVRLKQGILLGKTGILTHEISLEKAIDTLLQNIVASFAIENEQLQVESLRSSLSKRMGLRLKRPHPSNDLSEGLARMMLDAISNLDTPLELSRLLKWHELLFIGQENTIFHTVSAGQLRGMEPMQVVSGRIDRPRVHYEAPPREALEQELSAFIAWFNQSLKDPNMDPLLRAAISHFWFVSLHPFEDGNGRITRMLTDLALAQADKQSIRLYAMSTTILAHRNAYYRILEKSQRGTTDITEWLDWFLEILEQSIQTAINKIEKTLTKSQFWQSVQALELSKEQVKILNLMLDDIDNSFEAGISASQYKKITKVSKATATRHLTDLLAKGCLEKLAGSGRSTRYKITTIK
jgi:Fic family protein